MSRFAEPVFVAAGLRTPFGRGGGALAAYDAVSLSVPVVQAMAAHAEPDLHVWGTVIPNLGWSNIARETWLDAKLNPNVPAQSQWRLGSHWSSVRRYGRATSAKR